MIAVQDGLSSTKVARATLECVTEANFPDASEQKDTQQSA